MKMKRSNNNRKLCSARLLVSGSAIALFSIPTLALAQSNELNDDADSNTIIVTAQKREQNLQEVPVAITAVTAEALTSVGISTTTDLSSVVPGLNVTQQLSSIAPIIRGVGNYNAAPGSEGAVAIYVDGVYQSDAYGSILALANIDRVEVLRGPQGTLFGRNATGGLIHVITRTPEYTPSGNISVSYANHETFEVSAYGTAGITDNIAADFAFFVREQNDGFGTNIATGEDATFRDELAIRSKLLIEPSDSLKITIAGDYADSSTDLGTNRRPNIGTTTFRGTPPPAHFWSYNQAKPHISENKQWGVYGRADLDLGGVDAMALVSYRENRSHLSTDQGEDALPFVNIDLPLESDTFTAELQLTSDSGGFLEWIAGLYYLDSRAGVYPFALRGPGVPVLTATAPGGPFSTVDRTNQQDTKSYAAFGEAVLNFTDATSLTLGARVTNDKRKFTGNQVIVTTGGATITPPTTNLKASYTKLTYRAVLDHQITDDIMVYASYSRGFKSGIFNLFSPAGDSVNPEILDSFEVGFKTEFGNSFRLNGAAFYYQYDDLQLTTQVSGASVLRNAAQAKSKGFELEATWFATQALTFNAGFSYVDAEFKDFPGAEITTANPTLAPCPSGPPFPNCVAPGNAAGNKLPRAPEFTFSIGGSYEQPVSFGSIGGSANFFYNDGFYNDFANRYGQDSYTLVNASIFAAFGDDEQFKVTAFGRNLFNTKYYSFGTATAFGDFIAPAFGREYGIRLGMNF